MFVSLSSFFAADSGIHLRSCKLCCKILMREFIFPLIWIISSNRVPLFMLRKMHRKIHFVS